MGFIQTNVIRKMFSVNKNPLIVVLGATGAGKSKLGLEIAEKLGGEVINADSMQVYEGLDIITNKVTEEEQKLVPHHLINFLSPRQEYTVTHFQEDCLKTITDIQDRGKFPVLVGGTNYYIEGVLFDLLLKTKQQGSPNDKLCQKRKEWYKLSGETLHKMLKEVDPKSAQVLHPNDKRKLIRSLEIYYDTGQQMSVLKDKQRDQVGGSLTGGPIRFPNACIFWVQCNPEVLEERIYRRVDTMIKKGLLKELADFHEEYNKERLVNNLKPDYENGIFQSIGFKEFHTYLTAQTSTSEDEKLKLLEDGKERMKISTWKYAKKQVRWINLRIVNRTSALPVYGVDATNPNEWDKKVLYPALNLLKTFYNDNKYIAGKLSYLGHTQDLDELVAIELDCSRNQDKTQNELLPCEICDQRLIPRREWGDHIKSKGHKHYQKRKRIQQNKTFSILESRKKQLEDGNISESFDKTLNNST